MKMMRRKLEEDLQARLGDGYKFSHQTVSKVGATYDAFVVRSKDSNISACLNLDAYCDTIESDADYRAVLENLVESAKNALFESPMTGTPEELAELSDYSIMSKKLTIEVVSKEANKELLKEMPHRIIEDMAIIYRFILESDDVKWTSMPVTNNYLDILGVSHDQLHADAMENAPKNSPVEFGKMEDFLGLPPDLFPLWICTNKQKIKGAAAIFCPGVMETIAQELGGSYYVLPSSIHDTVLIPHYGGKINVSFLKDMVEDVNAIIVKPEDKLTDSVYFYDADQKVFKKVA